jgi:hypothetical protein
MGLDFLRSKKESFDQKRDKARFKELDLHDLRTRLGVDEITTRYRCQLDDRAFALEESKLLILRHIQGDVMHVLSVNRKIGHVLPEEVPDLIAAMRKNQHIGEFLTVMVISLPEFDGTFTVKPKTAFKR